LGPSLLYCQCCHGVFARAFFVATPAFKGASDASKKSVYNVRMKTNAHFHRFFEAFSKSRASSCTGDLGQKRVCCGSSNERHCAARETSSTSCFFHTPQSPSPPCHDDYSYTSPSPPRSILRTVSTLLSRTRVPCRTAPPRPCSPHPRLLPVASCLFFWLLCLSTFCAHYHLLVGDVLLWHRVGTALDRVLLTVARDLTLVCCSGRIYVLLLYCVMVLCSAHKGAKRSDHGKGVSSKRCDPAQRAQNRRQNHVCFFLF